MHTLSLHDALPISDASVTAFWVWLKSKYGFTDDQVRKYNYSAAPFLADPKAIQQGYVTSEPYTIEKEGGFKPAVFLLADEGYPGYAAMVLAPDSLITKDPKAVRAFVEASAAGWASYLNGDARPGDALILKDNPEMTQALLDQARAKMKAYGLVEAGDAKTGGLGLVNFLHLGPNANHPRGFDVIAKTVFPYITTLIKQIVPAILNAFFIGIRTFLYPFRANIYVAHFVRGLIVILQTRLFFK
jgi:hypothetical protein